MTAYSPVRTLSDVVWPTSSAVSPSAGALRLARGAALALCFSILIALTANVQFRLPHDPVPITGQTFGVLLTGALLGSRLGAAAVLLYLLEGMLGLPVYASAGGVSTYGYLAGFVPSAILIGWMAERGWDKKPLTTTAMMVGGSAVTYTCGASWLSRFVGVHDALWYGILWCLPGDAIKAALAAALLPAGWRLIGTREGDAQPRSNRAD